jgi:hypothetical protein
MYVPASRRQTLRPLAAHVLQGQALSGQTSGRRDRRAQINSRVRGSDDAGQLELRDATEVVDEDDDLVLAVALELDKAPVRVRGRGRKRDHVLEQVFGRRDRDALDACLVVDAKAAAVGVIVSDGAMTAQRRV